MDQRDRAHLDAWLDRVAGPDEQDALREKILDLLDADPELLIAHSWPEIRNIATISEQVPDHECSACGGSGLDDWDGRQPRDYYSICPTCLGSGRVSDQPGEGEGR